MSFLHFAQTPPMGWNSWDCYGASVTEAEVIAHADFMAEHLKAYGWEYVVVDIQWSEPEAKSTRYNDFCPLCMDDYSRCAAFHDKQFIKIRRSKERINGHGTLL